MSIHQLTPQNFSIAGRQRRTLNINICNRPILVFFKMENCPGCIEVEPFFYQLASEEKRIDYGIANLTNYREIVGMSRHTATPITTVPFFLLYVHCSPHAKYNGKKRVQAMKSFITKALASAPPPPVQTQTQGFMPQQSSQGGGMYGSGGYSHPSMGPQQGQQGQQGPQQGHAGYSQRVAPQGVNGPKTHQPEIGNAPNMQGAIKGSSNTQYAYLNDVDEDDAEKLLLPGQVTPHNVPWQSEYKKVGTMD